MGRYLMFISYIGTRYHGLQIQNVGGHNSPKVKTVQGVLQNLLRKINPYQEVKLSTSSRTDAGVHALCNAMHFDLQHRNPEKTWDTDILTLRLNSLLRKAKEEIRVLNIQQVNDDFISRYKATGRSYVFRLAYSSKNTYRDLHPFSVLDQNMALCLGHPVNFDLFVKASEILAGTHDFTAFTTENFLRTHPQKSPIKTLTIGVKKGQSFQDALFKQEKTDIDFWDVHFHSSSFLYHQVRIMMGAMVNVGRGKLHPDDLCRVLDDHSHKNQIPQALLASVPPSGLYLKNVHYNEEDLVYTPSVESHTTESVSDRGVDTESHSHTVDHQPEGNSTDGVEERVASLEDNSTGCQESQFKQEVR